MSNSLVSLIGVVGDVIELTDMAPALLGVVGVRSALPGNRFKLGLDADRRGGSVAERLLGVQAFRGSIPIRLHLAY